MPIPALRHPFRKEYSSRIWFACVLLITMIVICSCEQNDAPRLDGVYRPFAFIPSFKIDGNTLMFRTGKKYRITKIKRASFEHVERNSIRLYEFFLIQVEARSALLLRNYALYIAPNNRIWRRNIQWHTAVVKGKNVEKWEFWLDRHGNKNKPPPYNRPGATRFFKTRGPIREIGAKQYGLVERPVRSGRRVWIKEK